jgi:hypothetical protein
VSGAGTAPSRGVFYWSATICEDMYGNSSVRDESSPELTAEQRKQIRQELSTVAARTRELLPGGFVVGSELGSGAGGPQPTVAVRPPVGAPVSATCPLDGVDINDECEDIAVDLAASAALRVKQAVDSGPTPAAR